MGKFVSIEGLLYPCITEMRLIGKILEVKKIGKGPNPPHKYQLKLRVINSVPPDDKYKNLRKSLTITRDSWRKPAVGERVILTEYETKLMLKTAWFSERLITDAPKIENPSGITYTLSLGRKVIYRGTESYPSVDLPQNLREPARLTLKHGRKTLDRTIYIPPSVRTAKAESNGFVYIKNPFFILQIAPSFGGRVVKIWYGIDKSPWQYREYYDFENNKPVPFGIGLSFKQNTPLNEPLKPIPEENPLCWAGTYTEKEKTVFVKYTLHPKLPIFTVEVNTPDKWENGNPHLMLDLPWVEGYLMEFAFVSRKGITKLYEYPKLRYYRPFEINESIDKPFVVKSSGLFLMMHSEQSNIKRLIYRARGTTIKFIFPHETREKGYNIKLTVGVGHKCLVNQNNLLLVISDNYFLGFGPKVTAIGKKLKRFPFSLVKASKLEKGWEEI